MNLNYGDAYIEDTFVLIKNYKICALSGILGPKRWKETSRFLKGFTSFQTSNQIARITYPCWLITLIILI